MDSYQLKPNEIPDLEIEKLGSAGIESPLTEMTYSFINEDDRILLYSHSARFKEAEQRRKAVPAFERAGPRDRIYFDPQKLNCGIVTCGGLCPGLNDVIRSIALSLLWQYKVRNVYGFMYGYNGLSSKPYKTPISITAETIDDIHQHGGTILSSSRGPQDPGDMVNTLEKMNINLLFIIGGDGTLRGGACIAEEIKKRKLKIGVIGVPKTIDNDISGIERTFGFITAVEEARSAVMSAHSEAKGTWNGIGLVKLMGRESGFIAAHASLANSDVNFCFVPEMPLVLDGEGGFLKRLEKRLERKHHAVIVVAEGAGQNLVKDGLTGKDASGNVKLKDIGLFLKGRIGEYFKKKKITTSIKYIDPSYMIRSLPANSQDSSLCLILGQNAVHAGMSGRTNMVVGYWNQYFTHVPISLATLKRKKIDPEGHLWQTVIVTTGQNR